jgi:hypothetical protein
MVSDRPFPRPTELFLRDCRIEVRQHPNHRISRGFRAGWNEVGGYATSAVSRHLKSLALVLLRDVEFNSYTTEPSSICKPVCFRQR